MFYLYIIFAIASVVSGAWLGYEGAFWLAGVTLFLGGAAFFQAQGMHRKKLGLQLKKARLKDVSDARVQLLEENFSKAVKDYDDLQALRPRIKDREMAKEFSLLQNVSGNMLRYLEKNPDRIAAAEDFIGIYQDRAAVILHQYVELEETQFASDELLQAKARIKDMLSSLRSAYDEEFKRILNYQILDLNAEIDVLKHSMRESNESQAHTFAAENIPPLVQKKRAYPINTAKPISFILQKISKFARGTSVIPQELYWQTVSRKFKASLLGIFLGGIGAHKFFLGKNFQGIGYIAFIWTGLPIFVGFIEGVRWLFMSVDDFYLDYCDDN